MLVAPKSCHCTKTDIGVSIPKGCFGKFHARSSWARKVTAVAGGVIDLDYRGNIIIIFHNYSNQWFHIQESDKIAQITIQRKAVNVVFEEVKNFEDKTKHREQGFSSTDTKKTCRQDVV